MKKKIKPCPFCKNDDPMMLSIPFDSRFGKSLKYVECMDCHSQGPWASTKKKAVKAWNRRGKA